MEAYEVDHLYNATLRSGDVEVVDSFLAFVRRPCRGSTMNLFTGKWMRVQMTASPIQKVLSLQLEREAFDRPRDCEKGVDVFALRKVDCVHQISLCGVKRLEHPTLTFTLCQAKSYGWRPAFLCGAFMIQCDQSRVLSFQSHAEYTTVQDVSLMFTGHVHTFQSQVLSGQVTKAPTIHVGQKFPSTCKKMLRFLTVLWDGESNSKLER